MPYDLSPSKFDDFLPDYDNINWLDTHTWTKKRVYDKNYWLVIPNQKFNFKLGMTAPSLTVFIKTTGEQFGDAITPKNIADFTVIFKCFDKNGNLIIKSSAQITNSTVGQIEYEFSALDFSRTGLYYGEFEFTITTILNEGTVDEEIIIRTLTLPDTKQRIEIIVVE